MSRSVALWTCLGTAIIAAAVIHAGPLNPPLGPVASSYKTLSDVEPRIAINATNTPGDAQWTFIIAQPGGYYLTGNVASAPGKSGIWAAVDNVSIDLNGFTLSGSASGLYGINVEGQGAVRKYGVITGFTNGASVRKGAAEHLIVSAAGGNTGTFGIRVTDGIIRSCTATAPGALGILLEGGLIEDSMAQLCNTGISIGFGNARSCWAGSCVAAGIQAYGSNSVLSDCSSSGCGTGFFVAGDMVLSNCFATANSGTGFSCLSRCTFRSCEAKANASGFLLQDNCIVTDCSAISNTGIGFNAGSRCIFKSCESNTNAPGFSLQDNCMLTDCAAVSNSGIGFQARDGGQFTNCRAAAQTGDGFNARFGARLESCASRSNGNDGIECSSGAHILNCSIDGAGPTFALIRLTGDASRIEGNSLIGGSFGIQTTGGGNAIIRNSCRGSANAYGGIAAGNDVGPIGAAATATSPWANIQY